jgi:protein SCO1
MGVLDLEEKHGEDIRVSEGTNPQNSSVMKHWFPVVAGLLALLIVGIFGYQYMQRHQVPVIKTLNDFTLDNIDGSKYTFSENAGKVRLVEFMFTNCPDVCPATTYNMAKLQEQLKEKGLFGDKVEFVTITFDPEFDTPEIMQKYAEKFKADQSGWKFLRGDSATIETVTKDFGMSVMKMPDANSPGGYTMAHSANMYLVDGDGNLRQEYGMAAEMDMELMMKEMELLAD